MAEELYNIYRQERSKFGFHIPEWYKLTNVEKDVWGKIAAKASETPSPINRTGSESDPYIQTR